MMRYKWQANTSGDGKFYAQRVIRAVNAKSVIQQMPQFILNTQRMVDHRDGNGLNNTGLNIRVCTPMQNARNRPVASRNKAGFKGVHPTKGTRSNWSAVIYVSGKGKFLGSYKTKEEAARAYDAQASKLFGEFARLNFPTVENPIPARRTE